jgi:hypothetical protein
MHVVLVSRRAHRAAWLKRAFRGVQRCDVFRILSGLLSGFEHALDTSLTAELTPSDELQVRSGAFVDCRVALSEWRCVSVAPHTGGSGLGIGHACRVGGGSQCCAG